MAHLASGTHPQWVQWINNGEREYSYAMGLLKNRDIHHAPSYGNVSGLHNDWTWGLPHVQTKLMSCSKCQFDENMVPAHRTGHASQPYQRQGKDILRTFGIAFGKDVYRLPQHVPLIF